MKRGYLAELHGMEREAGDLQTIMELGDIRQLAPDPVQRLANDHVEAPRLSIGNHPLILGAVSGGAGERAIGVELRHRPAARFDVASADLDLVVYGGVGLVLGGIAGVNNGTHGKDL